MNENSIIGATSSNVYVDIEALTGWSNKINTMNEEAIDILTNINSTITSIEDYWVGTCASGFIEDSTNLVESVRKCHNDMKSIPIGLNEVVKVKSSE